MRADPALLRHRLRYNQRQSFFYTFTHRFIIAIFVFPAFAGQAVIASQLCCIERWYFQLFLSGLAYGVERREQFPTSAIPPNR